MASLPPAEVGWSMSDGGISTVGQRWLEYELQKILTVGWGINYISHHYPLCARQSEHLISICLSHMEHLVPLVGHHS